MAAVADLVPPAKTGGAMAFLGATSALGTALGPSLGGLLLAGFGWRAIFLAMLPLGLLALRLAHRSLPSEKVRPAPERARFDVAGAALLALTLAAYALAMTCLAHGFGAPEAGLLALAAAGVVLFLRVEARAEAPLVPPDILREPVLRAALAMSALVSAVVMASLVIGPFYLAGGLGLGAAGVGLTLSAGPASAALAGLPAGWAVNRFGPRAATAAGLAGMAAGCGLLALLPRGAGLAGYVGPIVVVTGSYALFQTANNSAVMAGADGARRGLVSGMLNLSRNLGLITGASAIAALFAAAAGSDAGPEAIAAAMRLTFASAAILVLAALVMSGRAGTGLKKPVAPAAALR
jgi:MFS family permease